MAFAEQVPHLLWVAGPDGGAVYFNRAGREYLGGDLESLLGHGWLQTVHPDDLAATRQMAEQCVHTGESFEIAYRLRRADGVYRWHLARGQTVRDSDGRVVRWVGTCTDIHASRAAADALREGESRYRLLFEANPAPMWVYDLATLRFLAVNDAAVAQYGYSRDEFLGMTIRDIRPPEELPALLDNLAAPRQEVERSGPWQHRRKDGSPLAVDIVSHAVKLDGRPVRLVLAADVTDRVRAEAALKASEARFRALIENTYDGITLLAADGTIVYASPSVVRIGGRTMEELLGRQTLEHCHPDDLAEIIARFQGFGDRPGETITVQYRYRHKDGAWRWVEATCTNLLADPAVAAIVCNFRDVTAQREAEAALQASEARYRAITEYSFEALALLDANGTYLYVSPASRAIIGYTPTEMLGRNGFELVHPDDLEAVRAAFIRLLPTPGATDTAEYRARHLDGSYRWVQTRATNLLHDPAVGAVVCNFRDITEGRKLEEQYRQAQKMEAVGRLAGGIAHDFNNLLTVITGYSEVALATVHEHDRVRPMLIEMKRAGERAAALTAQLLAFGRQAILQTQVLDLNTLVADLQTMLARVIGEDVRLDAHLHPAPLGSRPIRRRSNRC
ncbi:MAG: PAS domain S-box protein [Gemmataceae bacterium]